MKVKVDGKQREVLVIALPAAITKGGKTTGEIEHVYAGTERLEEGTRQAPVSAAAESGSVRVRHRGRPAVSRIPADVARAVPARRARLRPQKGLTWHTIRHEFVSRTIENTGDPVVTQKLARHKDGRTTQGYLHARDSHVLAAAVRLNRG